MTSSKRYKNLSAKNFLVIGRAGLDLYADPPGTHIEDATQYKAALGGSAANIAVALNQQGCKTALLTAVSSDAVGRATVKALSNYGVGTDLIKTVGGEARNSLAVVETRNENCQSVIYRNNAADFQVTEADVATVNYAAFAALIVTGTALACEPSRSATRLAMRLAKTAGLLMIIDLDYRPYSWASMSEAQQVCTQAASICDVIVGNDEEFDVLAGSSSGLAFAENLGRATDRIVIYKMGSKGCKTFAGNQQFETPIFPVSALKPTGAGDGFMGGFLAGLAAQKTLPEAVRCGAATAAIVVTRVGCAPALPTTEELHHFMTSFES